MTPRWDQDGEKIKEKRQRVKKQGWTSQRRPSKVANMVPTWVSKWSQDDQQIHSKIDHFFDASWNRFLGGFWFFLDTKMDPN